MPVRHGLCRRSGGDGKKLPAPALRLRRRILERHTPETPPRIRRAGLADEQQSDAAQGRPETMVMARRS